MKTPSQLGEMSLLHVAVATGVFSVLGLSLHCAFKPSPREHAVDTSQADRLDQVEADLRELRQRVPVGGNTAKRTPPAAASVETAVDGVGGKKLDPPEVRVDNHPGGQPGSKGPKKETDAQEKTAAPPAEP